MKCVIVIEKVRFHFHIHVVSVLEIFLKHGNDSELLVVSSRNLFQRVGPLTDIEYLHIFRFCFGIIKLLLE